MSVQIRESDLSFIRSRMEREQAQRSLQAGIDLGEGLLKARDWLHRLVDAYGRAAAKSTEARRHILWE